MVEFAAKQTPILSVLIWKLPPRHLYAELQQNPNLTSQRTKLYQRESSAKHSNTSHQASRNTATSASIFSPFSSPFFFNFCSSDDRLFGCFHAITLSSLNAADLPWASPIAKMWTVLNDTSGLQHRSELFFSPKPWHLPITLTESSTYFWA